MSSISFRASARTIDHLGKGQIADTPTAVSELWKNAYDAYARNVALHMFDGDIKCGAVTDNGCGMTLDQIQNSWLVIGTNAKTKKQALHEDDRFGLPIRSTQGEKGIGRLSVAFLAPVTFLVTKKIDSDYSAVLIDWRMFENPYLSLSDITVPFASFKKRSDIKKTCNELIIELKKNLYLSKGNSVLDKHEAAVRTAWDNFSNDEVEFNALHNNDEKTSEQKIIEFCDTFEFNENNARHWFVSLDDVAGLDGGDHGSALFLLDLNRELSLLTNREDKPVEDFEVKSIRDSLVDTLKAFIDPFNKDIEFEYEIKVYDPYFKEEIIHQSFECFGIEEFNALEHRVVGEIDHRGTLNVSVTAFGKEMGEFVFPTNISLSQGLSKVGRFKIKIGTIDDIAITSLDKEIHSKLDAEVKQNAGILIFRDELRVLPYGRVDNDFFEIEERRGKNAGRYFWANRRMIGHIELSQEYNSTLKDKAGREGFIVNQATRELKAIVVDHLINLADKFFGAKSGDRKIILDLIRKERAERKEAQTKAAKQTQKSFKTAIAELRPKIDAEIELARSIYNELSSSAPKTIKKLEELHPLIEEIESYRGQLKTPIKPPKLSGRMETAYREYRDIYAEYTELVKVSWEKFNELESTISSKSPYEMGKRSYDSKQSLLNSQIGRYEKSIQLKVGKLSSEWKCSASVDRGLFHQESIATLESIDSEEGLEIKLNTLDAIYMNLADSMTIKYEAILKALDRLGEGVNLDSAYSMAEEEKEYFENKAKELSALAQLGVSVEVIGHELEQQDMLVTRGLNSLPAEIKSHPGYKTALTAHKQLTSQIRFLSPLKLSGYQSRQDITGVMIENHIKRFFSDRFERQRIEFSIGESFRKITLRDLPSRIYPVFVNIINNAMYWVSLAEDRKIAIEILGSHVVIGNTGPAVDEDDVPRLFDLFYSKRTGGHGVGLYLCKENLAVAYHKIWYAESKQHKIFNIGANFVIEFKGMEIRI
jgi:hypothetical protein